MKVFAILAVFCASAIAVQAGKVEDMPPELLAIITSCKAETGASDSDMEAMMKHQPAATMEGKCVKSCILQKLSLMTADGKINMDVAVKLMDAHLKGDADKLKVAQEIMDVCKDITVSSNLCEAAEQYGACMVAEAGKRGINTEEF